MKKYRLKKEVKQILIITLLTSALIGLLIVNYTNTRDAVETCKNNGVKASICEELAR